MAGGVELMARVDAGGCVIAPDVHDLIAAQLAAEIGFEAVYLGSYASAASRWGLPDQSLLTMSQLIDHARVISDRVETPLILDFEDGGGNPVTCYRNVEAAARVGVAAVQIEDDRPGKGLGADAVTGLDDAVAKIRAACDARDGSDMLVIGRTGVVTVGGSVDDAIARCRAFAEAGADLVTPSMLPKDELTRFAAEVGVPVAGWAFGTASPGELRAAGLSIAIYPMQTTVVTYEANRRFLRGLRDEGRGIDLGEGINLAAEMMETNTGNRNVELAKRYGMSRPPGE